MPIMSHMSTCAARKSRRKEVVCRFLHPEDTMNDADLVIIESWQDVPLKGGCSACPQVIFDAAAFIGNKRQQELTLTAMFSVHYDQVHKPPDQLLTNWPSHPAFRASGNHSRRKPQK